mgnify:CR=1 FL=1
MVALDTNVTPELHAEGVTRDLVRAVQSARKDAGLDVTDRISLALHLPADQRAMVEANQQHLADSVHRSGTALLGIINDILDFSKIEAGKLDLESTDFKLDEVISSVTTLTAQKAHDKGLEFLAHVSPGLPEVLLGIVPGWGGVKRLPRLAGAPDRKSVV